MSHNWGTVEKCENWGDLMAPDVSGICNENLGLLFSCSNYAELTGLCYATGVSNHNFGIMITCANYGRLLMDNNQVTGGAVGLTGFGTGIVVNCLNVGNINTNAYYVGGIVGRAYEISTISNCLNVGNITSTRSAGWNGGLVGSMDPAIVENSFNLGVVSGAGAGCGGIAGGVFNGSTINNAYNIDTSYYRSIHDTSTASGLGLITNNTITINGTTMSIVDSLNNWVNANKQTYLDTYNVELKNWVMGDNGYPTFAN